MRIVNYKRLFFSLMLILLVCSFSINIVFSMVTTNQSQSIEYRDHIVQSGETVWEIAKLYNVEKDIRDFICLIAKENQLVNFSIYPGQTLIIPIN